MVDHNPKIEVYLPDSNLQAEDTPFYAVWDSSENFAIRLEIPKGMTLKELYNVDEKEIGKGGSNVFLIRKPKVNGYLSGILASTTDASNSNITKAIKISLTKIGSGAASDEENLYEPKIKLFRPDVQLFSEAPKRIKIKKTPTGDVELDGQLSIVNRGEGIGVVLTEVLNKEVSVTYSEGIGKFFEELMKGLKIGLTEISKLYPNYSSIISTLILFLDRPIGLTKEEQEKLRTVITDFQELADKDEGFATEISIAVNSAILRSIQLKPDLSSFVAYTKTGAEGKILNSDALKSLKVDKGEHVFLAKMKVYDLGQNPCGEIILPEIILETDEEVEVPFYDIVLVKHR
ncbi:MAG: hypothetical protein BK997_03710 [Candidatus Micrarchaeum sp. ARMAN-1]|nr:MAG: hypothetical protein BK997_03710 [Candidatus Micrarchaeum sp. ARMAN-1]